MAVFENGFTKPHLIPFINCCCKNCLSSFGNFKKEVTFFDIVMNDTDFKNEYKPKNKSLNILHYTKILIR